MYVKEIRPDHNFWSDKTFLIQTGNVNRQVGDIEQKEVLKLSAISVDSELDFCNSFNCVNDEDD